MQHRYEIYGLQVRSTEPLGGLLPGRPESSTDLDVVWCRDKFDQVAKSTKWIPLTMSSQPSTVMPVTIWRSQNQDVLRLQVSIGSTLCDFVFDSHEQKLSVHFSDEITRGRVRPFLLGSVMSSILRLRGTICLHSSVVSLKGQAIAFVAYKGDGKSTIAAALSQRGASVLSDDIAAITREQGRFIVHPGEMDIRLMPSSVGALCGKAANQAHPPGLDGKVRVRLGIDATPFGHFAPHAVPLAAVYLFGKAITSNALPWISQVRPGDRYMALFRHLYGFWLDKDLTQGPEFKALSQLVDTVPIYQINRRRDLDQLPLLCEAIIEHISNQKPVSGLKQASAS